MFFVIQHRELQFKEWENLTPSEQLLFVSNWTQPKPCERQETDVGWKWKEHTANW